MVVTASDWILCDIDMSCMWGPYEPERGGGLEGAGSVVVEFVFTTTIMFLSFISRFKYTVYL